MSEAEVTPEARFDGLVERLRHEPGVTYAPDADGQRRFGASALKVDGKIFSMLVKDRLVVKLPRPRVDALVATDVGERFDPGHGRPMKEWLAVGPGAEVDWLALASEARTFVGRERA